MIDLKNLTKVYAGSKTPAVDKVNISINSGEIYGLLGPNGAGKTTTIRMIMGFIGPSSGRVSIFNEPAEMSNYLVKKRIGYLPSDMEFYPHMSGKQFLEYLGSLGQDHDKKYFEQLVKKFDIDLDKKIEELSRGNRQKIAILQALMHQPEVLILDEPTTGLDPLMQEVFYDEVLSSKERGSSILLSSHILAEVQKICDRVGIIRAGKMVDEKNVVDLLKSNSHNFVIEFGDKIPLSDLKKLKGIKVLDTAENTVTISYDGKLNQLLGFLSSYDIKVLQSKALDLEEIFLGYYENEDKK